MNYNSIEEILAADTTNMTVVRNNTKNDDGTDTITGVNWFTFNGVVASSIYVNGNSWFGFGATSEHLKVNRRDGAVYSIFREEGTLYNHYKFLKIRWIGYSTYSSTSTNSALTYDVILWDTGDISLHMIKIPTSNNNGTYSLTAASTYTYTVNANSVDVTFTKTDSGFTVNNGIITLIPPLQRYLIRSGTTYYTVAADALVELTVTDLTSDVFLTSGLEEIPSYSLLAHLDAPELLYWIDSPAPKQGLAVITGTPTAQVIYYETESLPEGQRLAKVDVAAESVLFTVSADNGQSWKYYDGNAWVQVSSETDGMDTATLQSLTSTQWAELITSSVFQFRVVLSTTESSASKLYYEFEPIE
jgi:hypothetical protein